MMKRHGFEGWYFKHQSQGGTVAFIPGRAQSGAFVQMIAPHASRCFPVSHFEIKDGVLYADDCLFSRAGCRIELPDVRGQIDYGPLLPLESDIMGPFRFFPMQCRHGVVSMRHTLLGALCFHERTMDFHGGIGYIEKDSGVSFPRSYLWLQCGDLSPACALMAAVAHIPFGVLHFTGCICAVLYEGREYRIATYRGARILAADAQCLVLKQGALRLEAYATPSQAAKPLQAPVRGHMSAVIRESCDVPVRVRLTDGGKTVFDLESAHAAYEYVPQIQ